MYSFEEVRPAYLEVDIDKVIYNLKKVRERIGDDVELMAAVKGDFYGIGIQETWKYLDENGADSYAVAFLSEAVELRNLGATKEILILGYTPPAQFKYLLEYDIMPAMYDLEEAKILSEMALKENKKAKIHIKIDTGMTRIGFDTSDDSLDKVEEISKLEGLEIAGIFSHFTSSDDLDKSISHRQAKLYHDFCDKLVDRGINIGKRHLSNSSAVIDLPEYNEDMIRNGYSLIGLHDDTVNVENLPIKLTCQLKARISRVRTVPKGTGVGYGATFVTEKEETTIATLPLGYTDGYRRGLSNLGQVLVNGKLAPVRGNICMDQLMIEVTGIDCKIGDEVILFGYEENAPTIYDVAKLLNAGYIEIISAISRRIPRVYYKDGKVVAIKDHLWEK